MMRISKSILAFVLAASLVMSSLSAYAQQTGQQSEDPNQDSGYARTYQDSGNVSTDSPLIITEIVADGPANSRFTYVEVFNNSDATINFKDYQYDYRNPGARMLLYTTGGQNVEIESGKTLILWHSNRAASTGMGNSVADFNKYYGVNLVENKDIVRVSSSGITNNIRRGFLIGKDDDSVISEAWCNVCGADLPTYNPDKLGVQYAYSGGRMSEKGSISKATPGSVEPSQVPVEKVNIPDTDTMPTINSVSAQDSIKNDGLEVQADISIPDGTTAGALQANLFYRQKNSEVNYDYSEYTSKYIKVPMEPDSNGGFHVTVDRSKLWGSEAEWYVKASYGKDDFSESDHKTVTIEEPDNVADDKAAPLIVTEISSKAESKYTYIEIYNRTDNDIYLPFYKIFDDYNYPYQTAAQYGTTFTITSPKAFVKSGKTMVLWLDNTGTPIDDFNQHYGTSLVENEDIVKINSASLPPTAPRWIRIGTTEDDAFIVAGFNENTNQYCDDDTSLQYSYPKSEENIAIPAAIGDITPGSVESWQVPSNLIPFAGYPDYPEDDGKDPTLQLSDGWTVPETINEGNQLYVMYDVDYILDAASTERYAAIVRDQGEPMRPFLIGTTINYQLDGTGEWQHIDEKKQARLGKFAAQIPSDILFGHDSVKFNVQAYTLYGICQTETKEVKINSLNDVSGVRLNVGDGSVLSGETTITANDGSKNADTKILVDGKQVSTAPMLENGAYFSVQCGGLNNYFKNALTAPYKNDEHDVITFFSPWCELPSSRVVRIDNKYLTHENGKYKLKLTLWAGGSGTPFAELYSEVADENHEDYTISNVQLRLENGKNYLPVKIEPDNSKTNTSTNLAAVHTIGDSSGMVPNMDMYFEIPDSDVTAVGVTVDTAQLSDGFHTITATADGKTASAKVKVDNTAPTIQAGIEEKSTHYQPFTLLPEIEDSSKISQETVTLDGNELSIPASIIPSDLTPGEHTIQIIAVDEGNNIATKEIKFVAGATDASTLAPGQNNITANSASLFVNVGNTQSNTAFLQGKSLTMKNGGITVASSENGEPSTLNLGGDRSVTVSAPYGTIPYELFTVNTGAVGEEDDVAVHWKGKASNTDANHTTSLYILNTSNNQWEKAGIEKDGGIETSFPAKDHTSNGKAVLLVQCLTNGTTPEINSDEKAVTETASAGSEWDGSSVPENYDFSFAWETDTQYYSESFPYHYDQMNQWIVDNRKNLDIRYVMHTGDLVDDVDMTGEWVNADHSMNIFDKAGMPYGVLGGNHDVFAGAEGYGNYWKYFGEDRFKDQPYYGGSYKNNLGHYDLLTENGQDFIILYMSWDVYTNEIEWMNQVLAQYSDRKAIIALHRYTNVAAADNLLDYTGKLVQKEVVAKNKSVIAVLNGHYHGASIQTDSFDDNNDGTPDRTVYQICTDYQSDPEGGSEYIKFLYFDLKNNKIYINSYSPYRQDYNYFDTPRLSSYGPGTKAVNMDVAELDVDFNTQTKTLQTDSCTVDVRTSKTIGSPKTGTGMILQSWTELNTGTTYGWYAKVSKDNGEVLYTPIMTFTTSGSSGGGKDHSKPEPSPVMAPPSTTVPPAVSSGLSLTKNTAVQPGSRLLFTFTCEKKPDAVVSGNGRLVSVNAPVTEWDPVTKIVTYSLSCLASPLETGNEAGIYVTIDGAVTKIGTVQVSSDHPFTSDTKQDIALKPGGSYTFKISNLKGTEYTFQTGDGESLQTSQIQGNYPSQDGSYLCKVTARKKGSFGVYAKVGGVSYKLFTIKVG
nr:lamin tail domain-containing protein [uncultured Caproiciproducens sp.]